jgi:ABC-type lipopolysaccharide export system ATPase subunit
MRDGGGNIVSTLEVDGVQLSFGERSVLQSVYLKVSAGRVTGLLGRNGCGKSCLMQIIHGTLDAPGKSVRIDGEWVERGYRHGVTYVPQHGFVPAGRLVANVLRDYDLDFDRLTEVFPAMKPLRHSPVATLSGGERRILEVFTVLASPWSRFGLLDEPFSQVSPLHAGVLKTMIADAARGGKGILVSDHLYRDVCEIAADLYLIAGCATRPVTTPSDLQKFGYIK